VGVKTDTKINVVASSTQTNNTVVSPRCPWPSGLTRCEEHQAETAVRECVFTPSGTVRRLTHECERDFTPAAGSRTPATC